MFSGIWLHILLRFSGMLLLQDVLLMLFNLVLFKSLLIGVSRCKQLGVEKLLLIEKFIVVMLWDFSLGFSVAICLSILRERDWAESYLTGFVYSDVNFVKPLLSCLRFHECILLVSQLIIVVPIKL